MLAYENFNLELNGNTNNLGNKFLKFNDRIVFQSWVKIGVSSIWNLRLVDGKPNEYYLSNVV